ncbi:MAG: cytochrome c nitrite reductase small subunit [Bacteroidales bacterium]|nr:cytochrome c nitrite reductase small subunit [Bacteroidales bacterium]
MIMKLIRKIIPPDKWKFPVVVVLGIFAGLSLYIFKISNASSYLSDAPRTCINCHVMDTQYATWFHSSHRESANCNDCHVPHNNALSKYVFKAKDGMRHATVFTLRNEPQVIRIKHEGLNVVQENCKRCHSFVNENITTLNVTGDNYSHGEGKLCWECHREIPHGTVRSLSSTPNALIPELNEAVPGWLKKLMSK